MKIPSDLKPFLYFFAPTSILVFSGMLAIPFLLNSKQSSASSATQTASTNVKLPLTQTFQGKVIYEKYVPATENTHAYYTLGFNQEKMILLDITDAGERFSKKSIEALVQVGDTITLDLPSYAYQINPTINQATCNTGYFVHHAKINGKAPLKSPAQEAESEIP